MGYFLAIPGTFMDVEEKPPVFLTNCGEEEENEEEGDTGVNALEQRSRMQLCVAYGERYT